MKNHKWDYTGAWSLGQKKEVLSREAGGKKDSADGM